MGIVIESVVTWLVVVVIVMAAWFLGYSAGRRP